MKIARAFYGWVQRRALQILFWAVRKHRSFEMTEPELQQYVWGLEQEVTRAARDFFVRKWPECRENQNPSWCGLGSGCGDWQAFNRQEGASVCDDCGYKEDAE